MEQKYGKETGTALEKARLPTTGALTQSQAMHILKLVYPEVPNDEIVRCAILCRDFGLHPLMKQIYIIPFWNKKTQKDEYVTVLGINATRQITASKGSFSYVDNTPRVMTKKEQETILGEVDESKIWAITKLMTKTGLEAQGYGNYPKSEMPYGIDKGNTKANMAFIRSERQAFSRLFPDALPQGVEVIDEAYIDVPDIGKIDKATGEIVGGEVTKLQSSAEAPKEEKQLETSAAEIVGEGFRIEMDFLKESLKALKWGEDTCKTFVISKYKVSPEGTLSEVLQRLTREQAEAFTKELSERLAQRKII